MVSKSETKRTFARKQELEVSIADGGQVERPVALGHEGHSLIWVASNGRGPLQEYCILTMS